MKGEFSRVGPVHFQPLELELAPVARFVSGRMLNAGCGNRDIGEFLRGLGATAVVNCDIASAIPAAVISPLEAMPFKDSEFDCVLCNAVLEHVEHIDGVMAELRRVLRPGGSLIISIPFLQPYHHSPRDFRRYTVDGLEQLAARHELKAVKILPVHSIAQTVGWILWEFALEKQRGWLKALIWPVVFLVTRLSYRTDSTLSRTANTYQVVLQKLR